jgi:ABC-type nitrate/sulfonate/bicarbonate transport system permease component
MIFGIGNGPAVAIVGLAALFPIWLGAQQGITQLRLPHFNAARSLGAGRWILLTDVVIPSVVPYVLHGLRIGVGLAWFSVVAAEMMGVPSGLGNGIQLFSLNLEIAPLYGYLLVIGVIGFLLNQLLAMVAARRGWWRFEGVRSLG